MSNYRASERADGSWYPRIKPFAIWVPQGIGYWIMRSFHDGVVVQGSAATALEAYRNWKEALVTFIKSPVSNP